MLQQEIQKLWGNWKIDKELGAGSFGTVYRITREEFGHLYEAALKVISIPQSKSEVDTIMNDGMDEASTREYFRGIVEDIVQEFALMSELKGNTNIVSYEDHAVVPKEDGFGWNIYIRMELLTPLFDYVKMNSITVRDVVRLGVDICKGLELCQKLNIIHRDIKPENIFVSKTGSFKLGDFGIARQLEKTSSGLSKKGTYLYMAPEVHFGRKYNSSVDLYSLGLVLYRFLNNNRMPFMPAPPAPIRFIDKEDANDKRLSGVPMPYPANASGELGDIILKACAYYPQDRYVDAREMRYALESILHENEFVDNSQWGNMKKTDYEISMNNSVKSIPTVGELADDYKEEDSDRTVYILGARKEKAKAKPEVKPEPKPEPQPELPKVEEKQVEPVPVKKEPEKTASNKKASKVIIIGAVVAVIAIIGGIIGVKSHQKSLERVVPAVVNMDIEEATALLTGEEMSLEIKVSAEENSYTVEKGKIISQNIAEGTVVKKGDTVEVVVSKGKLIEIPDLVGKKESAAKNISEEKTLIFKVSEEKYSDDVKKGYIISQSVKAGTQVNEGTEITVVVSKGIEQVEVPKVTGKSESKAKEMLKEAKLKYSTSESYSSTVAKGKVISQSIDAGKKVDKNSKVKLVISKGKKPEPVYTPPVTSTPSYTRPAPSKKPSSNNDTAQDINSWDDVN